MKTRRVAARRGGSVVLMREGASGCAVLLRALSARGLSPEVVHDEPGAMLALAMLSARADGLRVLIVVEPTRWPRLDQLLTAVQDYHRAAHCWRFDCESGASAMLSDMLKSSYRFVQGENGTATEPVGRVRKRRRPVDRLLVSAPEREEAGRGVVTQQELTMLLGPAPGEAG